MDMQDKEFDDVFRSKLDGVEMEPSAKVWPGIANELDSAKRKKTLMPWLSIAAGIIVLVGIGILFIPRKPAVNTTKPLQPIIARVITPTTTNGLPNELVNIKLLKGKPHRVKEINNTTAVIVPQKSPVTIVNKTNPPIITLVPVKTTQPELIAVMPQKQQVNIAVVPDKTTVLTPTLPDQSTPDITTKPVLLASQVPAQSKKDSAQVKPKHKIHGIAGLVTMVIAKVDKRKDNAQSDDDNESNIVGVNLGLVKIKKGE